MNNSISIKLFENFSNIQDFINSFNDYSLISKKTPLISNLNICENISLIKEVHEYLKTKYAQKASCYMLKKIDLSNITFKRPNECSTIEIFYAMFIRALMTKKNNIIIVTPYAMIHNLKDLNPIFDNIRLLNKTKNIIILDILTNEAHYTELGCDIEK